MVTKPTNNIKGTDAWAVVKKKIMKINALDIFADKSVEVGKDEIIIKVRIEEKK